MKIVSWNIQWGRGIDGGVDLARVASVAHDWDADVYCFQEVAVNHPDLPGGAAMDQVAVLAGCFPGYASIYGIGSDLPDGSGGRRFFGNLILSRLPVLQVFRHLLPWPIDPAVSSMPRIAVEAVIETSHFPGSALRVITTHLEYYSLKQRTAQIRALRELCDTGWQHAVSPRVSDETDPPFAVLPRGEGVVLCGDFNCPPGSPEQTPLTAASPNAKGFATPGPPVLRDAWSIAHPGLAHTPTVGLYEAGFTEGPSTYDFFFVSTNIASSVRDVLVNTQTTASDHQPVMLVLR